MSWLWIVLAALRPGPPDAVVATAKSYVGTPYVYGGANYDGVDCSGLVMVVYSAHGVSLPRTAGDQARMGWWVSRKHVAPGDLLFFTNELGSKRIDHVGLAVDAEHVIHASTSRHRVVVDRLDARYFQERLLFVRRLLPPPRRQATTLASAVPAPTAGAARGQGLRPGGARGKPLQDGPLVKAAPGARAAPKCDRPAGASGAKTTAQECLPRRTRSASETRK